MMQVGSVLSNGGRRRCVGCGVAALVCLVACSVRRVVLRVVVGFDRTASIKAIVTFTDCIPDGHLRP